MTAYDITLLVREFSDSEVFALNRISSVIGKSDIVAVDEFAENLKDPSRAPKDKQVFLDALVRMSRKRGSHVLPLRCVDYDKSVVEARWDGFMDVPYSGRAIACCFERWLQASIIFPRLNEHLKTYTVIAQPAGARVLEDCLYRLCRAENKDVSLEVDSLDSASLVDSVSDEFQRFVNSSLSDEALARVEERLKKADYRAAEADGFRGRLNRILSWFGIGRKEEVMIDECDIFCGKHLSETDRRAFMPLYYESMAEITLIRNLDRNGGCKDYFYI